MNVYHFLAHFQLKRSKSRDLLDVPYICLCNKRRGEVFGGNFCRKFLKINWVVEGIRCLKVFVLHSYAQKYNLNME